MDQPGPDFLTIGVQSLPDEDSSICLSARGWSILVCRSGGVLFAIENRCTHLDMELEGGRVRRGAIFCPHHGARFMLASGAAVGRPASQPIQTFQCRETPAGLVIELPRSGSAL